MIGPPPPRRNDEGPFAAIRHLRSLENGTKEAAPRLGCGGRSLNGEGFRPMDQKPSVQMVVTSAQRHIARSKEAEPRASPISSCLRPLRLRVGVRHQALQQLVEVPHVAGLAM